MIPLFKPPARGARERGGRGVLHVTRSGRFRAGQVGERLRKELGALCARGPALVVLCDSFTGAVACTLDHLRVQEGMREIRLGAGVYPKIRGAVALAGWQEGPGLGVEAPGGRLMVAEGEGKAASLYDWRWEAPPKGLPVARFVFLDFWREGIFAGAEGAAVLCRVRGDADGLRYFVQHYRDCAMGELQAAVDLESVLAFPRELRAREKVWRRMEILCEKSGIRYRVRGRPGLFQVEVPEGTEVPKMQETFTKQDIETGWLWPPARWLAVPCWSGMTADESRFVVQVAKAAQRGEEER